MILQDENLEVNQNNHVVPVVRFPLYTTGTGCVLGALVIFSPVCIVRNPVESIRMNFRKQVGSFVIFLQLFSEHSNDSFATSFTFNDKRGSLVPITRKLLYGEICVMVTGQPKLLLSLLSMVNVFC